VLRYEPVGLLDLPPGNRGYGQSQQKSMEISIESYNATVKDSMAEAGSLPTAEPMGSRMQWGAWRNYEDRPIRPERNE
jgi:hypothetical protein